MISLTQKQIITISPPIKQAATKEDAYLLEIKAIMPFLKQSLDNGASSGIRHYLNLITNHLNLFAVSTFPLPEEEVWDAYNLIDELILLCVSHRIYDMVLEVAIKYSDVKLINEMLIHRIDVIKLNSSPDTDQLILKTKEYFLQQQQMCLNNRKEKKEQGLPHTYKDLCNIADFKKTQKQAKKIQQNPNIKQKPVTLGTNAIAFFMMATTATQDECKYRVIYPAFRTSNN